MRVSNPLDVLGWALASAGRYSEAEAALKEAIALREKIAPSDIFTLDTLLVHLGANYRSQGRLSEAEPVLKRALSIREGRFPSEHPEIADALFNLGALYRTQSRYSEAEPMVRRSLAIREAAFESITSWCLRISKAWPSSSMVWVAMPKPSLCSEVY